MKWRLILVFTRESSYCFQRVLDIAVLSVRPSVRLSVCLSVRHTGGSVKNRWRHGGQLFTLAQPPFLTVFNCFYRFLTSVFAQYLVLT